MGLAASQARLLTITARLADNELRSQTINNAKMRLATQSAQASDEYVSALNDCQLMFSNVNENGLAQTIPLTFNSLTQFSQYNNQYGLVNSSGQLLVSEEDAKIFQAHSNDLEGFLKAHGLEWETTFFDEETSGNLKDKLTSFYSGDYSYIGDFFDKTNDDLKNLYLNSISEEASIEALNYENMAHKYYQAKINAYNEGVTDLRNKLFTDGATEETVAEELSVKSESDIKKDLKTKINKAYNNNTEETSTVQNNTEENSTAQNNTGKTSTAQNNLTNYVNSLKEVEINNKTSDNTNETIFVLCHPDDLLTYYTGDSGIFDGITYKKDYSTNSYTITIPKDYGSEQMDTGESCKVKSGIYNNEETGPIPGTIDEEGNITFLGISNPEEFFKYLEIQYEYQYSDGESEVFTTMYSKTEVRNDTKYYKYTYKKDMTDEDHKDQPFEQYRTDQKKDFIINFFEMLFSPEYLPFQSKDKILEEFKDTYGFIIDDVSYLLDFDKLIKDGKYDSNTDEDGIQVKDAFQSVRNVYFTQKMVDVLGEPNFAWIDKSANPTDNPDSKAQWLTNLFNRMQKGYKVLENGLASSKEWIEYAFESGLVTMEQVDMSQNWIGMDYKTCSNIFEETDNSTAVAKAEAKYNRAMNDIKQKDSLYDLELKNIDTEHNSLQTEYDVIKGVINKNIERTMKFNQSA